MATTRIMPLHTGKGRSVGTAIRHIPDYVENPEKTDNGRLITGYGCDIRIVGAEFLFSTRQYAAITGRARGADNVIAYPGCPVPALSRSIRQHQERRDRQLCSRHSGQIRGQHGKQNTFGHKKASVLTASFKCYKNTRHGRSEIIGPGEIQ